MSPLFAIEAEKLLNQGKVQEAIDLCLEGLKQYPKYASAEAVLARAYKEIGDDEKADETLAKAIEKNPLNRTFKSIKQHGFILPEPPAPKVKKKNKKVDLEMIPEEFIPEIIEESFVTEKEIETFDDFEEEEFEELEISASDEGIVPGLKSFDTKIDESQIEINLEKIENIEIVENKVNVEFISTSRIQEKILEFRNKEDLREKLKEEIKEEIKETEELDPIEKLALELEDAKIIPSDAVFPDPFADDSDFFDLETSNKTEEKKIVKKKIVKKKVNNNKKSKKTKDKKEEETAITETAVTETAVTETIAELYYKQGALAEAVKAYRMLAKEQPDNAKKFRARARKIKKEIKD